MNKSTYKRYLRCKHWQQLRFEVLKRSNGSCEQCGYKPLKRGCLQVHHKSYENVGNESLKDLIALCPKCHMEAHGITRTSKLKGAVQDNKKNGL